MALAEMSNSEPSAIVLQGIPCMCGLYKLRRRLGGQIAPTYGQHLAEPMHALARWGAPLMTEMEDGDTFRSDWLDFPVQFIFGGWDEGRPAFTAEIRADDAPVTMESAGGEVRFRPGPAVAPDLVLTGRPDVIVGILSGRLDKEAAERCPVFPGMVKRIPWSFKDPSAFKGTKEEILQQTREVRDEIEEKIKAFVREGSPVSYWIPATEPTH